MHADIPPQVWDSALALVEAPKVPLHPTLHCILIHKIHYSADNNYKYYFYIKLKNCGHIFQEIFLIVCIFIQKIGLSTALYHQHELSKFISI